MLVQDNSSERLYLKNLGNVLGLEKIMIISTSDSSLPRWRELISNLLNRRNSDAMNNLSIFHDFKILITGHTGFKGSWLSLWLAELGAEVHGVSVEVPSEPSHFLASHLASRIHDHRVDICDQASLMIDLVKKTQPDFVFHLAAQALVRAAYSDPTDTWRTNTVGTVNVLESMRSLKATLHCYFYYQ